MIYGARWNRESGCLSTFELYLPFDTNPFKPVSLV